MSESRIEEMMSAELGMTKARANEVWNAIEKMIPRVVMGSKKGRASFRGLGAFYILEEGGRPSRMPGGEIELDENGDVVLTDAYTTMRFAAGKETLAAINPIEEVAEII